MHVDLLLAFAILESTAACGHRCFTSCDQTPIFIFYFLPVLHFSKALL